MTPAHAIPGGPTATRRIGGYDFTLTPGRIYLASRPFARRGVTRFVVSIADITDGYSIDADPVATVWNLTYDEANALLAAFNHGKPSFAGRVW